MSKYHPTQFVPLLLIAVFALASTLGGSASAGPRTGPAGGARSIERSDPPIDGGAPPIPVDGGADVEVPPCEGIAAAYADAEENFAHVFAELRAEIAEEVAQLDARIAASADVDARLAAADAELGARASALTVAVAACVVPDTPAGCSAVIVAQTNLDAAVEVRDAILQEREQLAESKGKRARLLKEDVELVKMLAKVLTELAKEKKMALDRCAATGSARGVRAARAALCGVSRVLQETIVVVADTSERATNDLAAIERTLGLPYRADGAGLIAANGRVKLGAIRSVLAKSEGKTLVIDGTGLLKQTGATRMARASQAVAAAALQLEPRIIVVRVEGVLDAAARATAKSRGWRIAGDASDGIKREICRQ